MILWASSRISAGFKPASAASRRRGAGSCAAFKFGFAAAVVAEVGDECAQALPAINDALAFQFLVGAFDGDDADEQIFRELAERRQRRAGLEAALADLAFDAVNDLLVKRAIRRGEIGR
jgi:hypothetical protein